MSSLPEPNEMFPDRLPQRARIVWQTAFKILKSSGADEGPSYRRVADTISSRGYGETSVYRIVHKYYPHLFPKWPIRKGQPLPWQVNPALLDTLIDPEPLDLQPSDQVLRIGRIELVMDDNGSRRLAEVTIDAYGVFHFRRWIDGLASVVAAGFAMLLVLDGLDGQFDMVIHWCRVIGHVGSMLTMG